jgi:hypothetical protein
VAISRKICHRVSLVWRFVELRDHADVQFVPCGGIVDSISITISMIP